MSLTWPLAGQATEPGSYQPYRTPNSVIEMTRHFLELSPWLVWELAAGCGYASPGHCQLPENLLCVEGGNSPFLKCAI